MQIHAGFSKQGEHQKLKLREGGEGGNLGALCLGKKGMEEGWCFHMKESTRMSGVPAIVCTV